MPTARLDLWLFDDDDVLCTPVKWLKHIVRRGRASYTRVRKRRQLTGASLAAVAPAARAALERPSPMPQTRRLASALALTLTLGCNGAPPTPPVKPVKPVEPCTANPHGVGCAFLVSAGAYRVDNVTSDGFAVVVDGSKNASMLDLTHGTLTPLISGFTDTYSESGVVFAAHGGAINSLALPVTIWSAAGGARELDPSVARAGYLHSDGAHVAWFHLAADFKTGDVMLGSVDGKTAPKKLAAGVPLTCGSPNLAMAGNRLLFGGYPSDCSHATLGSYDLDSGALVGSVSARTFSLDRKRQQVLFRAGTGAAIANLDLTVVTPSVSDFVSGRFTPDGASIIYVDNEKRLARAPLFGGTPTIVQPGPVLAVEAVSPDGAWATYSTQRDAKTGYPDLHLTGVNGAAATAVTLRQQTDWLPSRDPFTPDSKFALYETNLDAQGNGTLSAQAVAGGAAHVLAAPDFYWHPVDGSRVVYNDQVHEGTAPNEFTDTTADIELLDLAGTAAPTTLVSGAGAGMFLTSDRQSLVYSLPSGAHPGVYMMRLP
jgi:hypothetical protein